MKFISIILLSSFLLLPTEKKVTLKNQKSSLEIRVTNIKKIKGNLLIAVFDDESKFLKDFSIATGRKITKKEHVIVFKDLPHGTYAVSIFQDENENNTLDTNFMGIPKEPYAFSNNPSTFFGPPDFQRASFKIDENIETIIVKL